MTIDPGALLVGPRGRRLCLELVVALAHEHPAPGTAELTEAVLDAAHHLDPGRGTARVLLGWGARAQEPPVPSPADVARLLDAVEPTRPGADALLRALAAAVDSARYWQEPDGEDVLAATPQMRQALARVATSIAWSDDAAWWTAPFDPAAQWQLRFVDPARPTPADLAQPAAERLARWRTRTVAEELAAGQERPRDARASWSGTWWSIPPAELTRTTRRLGESGPVGLNLVEDSFGWEAATATRVAPAGRLRVWEIDGPEAWAELCRRYPLEVTASRRHDWFRTTGRDERWVVPDWARAGADVDVVHLTAAGYLATAGRAVAVDAERHTVLAGWDPDQAYWLTDTAVADADGETWLRLQDDVWHRA